MGTLYSATLAVVTDVDTGTATVRASIIEGVGTITLDRPERRNALHRDMYDAIPSVLDRFERDDEVGCIIVTGAGSAFCAGGDVRDGQRERRADRPDAPPMTIEAGGALLAERARMVVMLHHSSKVTIAALPGPAVGAGLGLALSTDLRIAARSVKLIPGWGQLGFSGDFGGSWFLTRLLGPAKAIELFVDNAVVGADEALLLGLVNRVVDDDELAGAAFAWARDIAAGPRAAWRLFKENVAAAMTMELAAALPGESERMARSGQTADHRAAVKAWLAAAEANRRP